MKARQLFSLLERIVYRAANSILALALAYFSGSKELGLFAFGSLALTFILSLTDSPIRQYVAGHSTGGMLHRNQVVRIALLGLVGSLVLLVLVAVIALLQPDNISAFLKLTPLVPVPLFTCFSMLYQAQIEAEGDWRKIFKLQLASVTLGTAISATLLGSLGAGAANLQTLLAEIFLLTLLSKMRRLPLNVGASSSSSMSIVPPMSSSLFGWLQGQSEKLILGFISGAATLGVYSLAASFSRTLGDAIQSGINNNLRSEIMGKVAVKDSQVAVEKAVSFGLRIALLQQIFLCALVAPSVGFIFGSSWTGVSELISMMSFSLVAGSVSWTLSNFLVIAGYSKKLLPWQILSLVLSVIGGAFLSISLQFGYLFIVARDLVILVSRVSISSRLGIRLRAREYRYLVAGLVTSVTSSILIAVI